MMSMDQIRSMSREAAIKARRKNRRPFTPTTEEACESPRQFGGIPFTGDYSPPGWKKVDDLFVDSSGMGSESEPAMTQAKFRKYMKDHLADKYAYTISEAGQFQCHVTVWEPLPGTRRHQRRKKDVLPLKAVQGEVSMQDVPSDDPIAYTMGFMHGVAGENLGERRQLAKAYIEGWQLGRDVRLGKTQAPGWAAGVKIER